MSIPAWLERHLTALGRWDADGIGRRANARMCRSCGARILAGLDAERCAFAVTVDPMPVDALGEMQALISGRRTFRLQYKADRWEIDHRTEFDIQRSPPHEVHVLVEHECGQPISGNGPPIKNPRPRAIEYLEVPF